MKNKTAILILAAAQFVMVLDSSVMNVSISQIVEDLDTTIQGVQLAITAYTLVMAAFMLVGAKLGDIWGRDRTFAIGLAVYATGSFITAISPNLTVLLFGWSLVEGLGAVLVVPAIAALIAANYEGKERALAYGLIGGVAAAAVAAGPLIGGWVTTTFTWRLVFVGEVVIVAVILLLRKRMKPSPRPEHPPEPRRRRRGAVRGRPRRSSCSAILQSSTWGWVQPEGRARPSAAREITPLGFSVVPFLILGGLGLLWALAPGRSGASGGARTALLDLDAALDPRRSAPACRRWSSQQLVLLGTFFVLPVYLQVVARARRVRDRASSCCRCPSRCSSPRFSGPRAAARRSPQAGRAGSAGRRSPSARSSCSRRSTWSSTSTGFAVGLARLRRRAPGCSRRSWAT